LLLTQLINVGNNTNHILYSLYHKQDFIDAKNKTHLILSIFKEVEEQLNRETDCPINLAYQKDQLKLEVFLFENLTMQVKKESIEHQRTIGMRCVEKYVHLY
jgi:hypothetical protein